MKRKTRKNSCRKKIEKSKKDVEKEKTADEDLKEVQILLIKKGRKFRN